MSDDYSSEDEIFISSDEEVWEPEDDFPSDLDEEDTPEACVNLPSHSRPLALGYNDDDGGPNQTVKFRPAKKPGPHIMDEVKTRGGARKFLTPLDFFKLYFTLDLVKMLCQYTNAYAAQFGPSRPTVYANWFDVTPDEFYKFLGLLMYMGIVKAPGIHRFWSTKSLYHGNWARGFMSKKRFSQIMSFLKVSNFNTEDNTNDKLCKVRFLYEFIHRKCQKLYQPNENLSIDERMVRNKGRYSFRQYIRDKPTKWGMKLWVLADAITGYTYDFEVYLGKNNDSSKFGLAYDVVMRLMKSVKKQGYRLFFDNFYTSLQLMKDLLKDGIRACGTIISNRKGFPVALKDTKAYEKRSERGDMRWFRDGDILSMQWRDNKTVTLMSNFHSAKGFTFVRRRTKKDGEFREIYVRQPDLVKDYNKYMGGVDKSDQLITKYNCLRQSKKYWKTLFFHFIDISRVNSYILFQDWRKEHSKEITELKRSKVYGQLEFTEELIRNLGGFEIYQSVPLASNTQKDSMQKTAHSILPEFTEIKRNCKLCYQTLGLERKVRTKCAACDTYLCFHGSKNCLRDYHKTP